MGQIIAISPALIDPLPSYFAYTRKGIGVWMDSAQGHPYSELTNKEKWVYSQVNIADQAGLKTQQIAQPNEHPILYKLFSGVSSVGNHWGMTVAQARAVRGILLDAATSSFSVGATNGSTTITSAGLFTDAVENDASVDSGDEGRDVTGTGIPAGTYITAVTNASTATLSQAYTGTTGTITLNLGGREYRGGLRGYGKELIFDPSVSALWSAYANDLVAEMTSDSMLGFCDGVWLDQSGPDLRGWVGGVPMPPARGFQAGRTQFATTWPPVDTGGSGYLTNYPYWNREFLRVAVPILQAAGIYVAANCSGFNNGTVDPGADTRTYWGFLKHADGSPIFDCYTFEYWLRTAGSGQINRLVGTGGTQYWQTIYNLPQTAYAMGADFGGIVDAAGASDDSQCARFTRGSFLLTWDKSKSAPILRGYAFPWNEANILDGDLGYPTAAESVIATNIHYRPFENGYVVVNPTASSWTGTVPDHGSQTVPSGDALIHVGA